jgi:hypothetical protein
MEQHCKNNVLGRLNLQLKTTTTKHIQTHNYFHSIFVYSVGGEERKIGAYGG